MKWLDLSCIHHLQSAAEPIQLDTQNLFTEAFSQFKLENSWFFVRYGLAEHVVGICWYHGYHLSTPREDDENRYLAINHPRTSHHSIDVKIMNPDTMEEVDGDTTGKIWISSPSVCAGYYRKQELIEQTFQATIKNSTNPTNNKTYLRTGDLGFFQNNHLFICGRQKDLIIVNGVNYYPQDIEHVVQDASAAVWPGCVVAFSSDDSGKDGQLEIVFEIQSNKKDEARQVCKEVKNAVIQQLVRISQLK